MLGIPPGTQRCRMGPIPTWGRTCRASDAICKLSRDSARNRNHAAVGPPLPSDVLFISFRQQGSRSQGPCLVWPVCSNISMLASSDQMTGPCQMT